MGLCLLCSALLLSGCGAEPAPVAVAPHVPLDLFQPCRGYLGPRPGTEGQISDALIAEVRGRQCANGKLATMAEMLNSPGPQ